MLALHELDRDPDWEPFALLSTINQPGDRVGMHEVPARFVERQARFLGISLQRMTVPAGASNAAYEKAFDIAVKRLKDQGVRYIAAGDIFLEDVRRYRQHLIRQAGFEPVFPLWGRDTRTLLEEFIRLEYRALTVCIRSDLLPDTFLGRVLDREFLAELPASVDPCGERGEFHTFVWDGPLFSRPVPFSTGSPYGQMLSDIPFRFLRLEEGQIG